MTLICFICVILLPCSLILSEYYIGSMPIHM
jgi:hypothetical protein